MPSWILPTIVAVLATALIATTTVAVVQYRAASQASAERDQLAADIVELRAEVDELRAELEEAQADDADADDGLGGLLDGLLGGDNDLDGLLDGLLGGDSGGLLDGLLGDDGDETGSAFDPSAAFGEACLVPDLGGGLGSLFGGGGDAPDDLEELVAQTSDEVADLRELGWEQDVEVEFLDDDATRSRLDELFELDDDERAAQAGRGHLLTAIGALPDDVDLAEIQQELLGDAVAGFYVPETGETVVRVPDEGTLGAADRITLAHELEHALADQTLGLPDRAEPPLVDDTDASLGALALVEGDASLVMNLWALEHLGPMELLGLASDPSVAASAEAFDDMPDVLVRELVFPYTVGLDWACDVYLDGGWAAVDERYEDPPSTSAEVLFGTPITPAGVADLGAPGDGFEQTYTSTFGAAELLWQLEAPGGDPAAAVDGAWDRASAWAGGTAQAWHDGQDTAAAISLAFDPGDAGCETMEAWARAAVPGADADEQPDRIVLDAGDRVVAVDCAAGVGDQGTDQVRVVSAPTASAIDLVLS